MGRPAKVLRTIRDSDVAWVREAGELYVQYARTFMDGGVRLVE